MKNRSRSIKVLSMLFLSISFVTSAQEGDQMLDGIGETGMIARYTFDGDVKDWSRNNLHGHIQGSNFGYVKDEIFGTVLSLAGKSDTYITLPGDALMDEESLSVSGWVYMRSTDGGQLLMDFKNGQNSVLHMAPVGTKATNTYHTQVTSKKQKYNIDLQPIQAYKWVFLAVVYDAPSKTLKHFVNGRLVNSLREVDIDLKRDFKSNSQTSNKIIIGTSMGQGAMNLNAKLHDFRLYRIALRADQIQFIHNNAITNNESTVRTNTKPALDLPIFSETRSQFYNDYLTEVPTITVETALGILPRLPRFIPGVYRNGMNGPEVRVLWPAPTDNKQVHTAKTYTLTGTIPGSSLQAKAIIKVNDESTVEPPSLDLESFKLNQVQLQNDSHNEKTKFIENRDKFLLGLAETDPDSFLYMFRNAYGRPQPEGAKPLRGWDSQETKLRGHATGHYLTAIAQAYESAGYDLKLQAKFLEKMQYLVGSLYEIASLSGKPKIKGGECVDDPRAVPPGPGKSDFDSDLSEEGIRTDYWNWGKGFISAYPPDQFIMLENGARYGADNAKVWAPYYTLHKILAGLLDIYEVTGDERALRIVEGMGDWVHARLADIPTQTLINMWNRYIAGEFGGMNEVMARLYILTQEPRYLKTAQLFDNINMFFGDAQHSHGLAKNVDMIRGLHANQHIPQIVGALEIYRGSQLPAYYQIADNFWDIVTNDYMYSIGGVAGARNPNNAECFLSQPATIYENGLAAGGQNETCATYNMLKLSRNLFLYDQNPKLMDYYERGLYNHILASVAENSPANTYHVPLRAGSKKQFGNAAMNGFTCCNGTALESSTKLQNTIYFKNKENDALYVNLYIPSTLNWKERDIIITQTTAFPKEDQTTFHIQGSGKFALNFRVPKWATKGFTVKINDKLEKVIALPGSIITLERNWQNGDKVELTMPFHFYLEPVMDQQNVASLFYGPILMAVQESEPRVDWRKVSFNANNLEATITGSRSDLKFEIDGLVLKPFYESYGRYSVYLDVTLE